MLLCEKFGTMI